MKKVICTDRNGGKHEVAADRLTLRPAVYGVIIKDGAILLSKQWDGYDFPGGKIELGEDIKDAVIREIKEETGLDAKVGNIVVCENSFYKTLPGDTKKEDCLHSILVYYLCEIVGGEISLENISEGEKRYLAMAEWIPLEDIEKIKFYNTIDSLKVIKQALEIIS